MIGSRGWSQVNARERVGERAVVPLLCVAAAVATGVSTWLLLDPRARTGGLGCACSGARPRRRRHPAPADRPARPGVLLSFGDRLFDGAVLGSIAWVTRSTDPVVAAGALVALAAGFLATYIRARGGSLGYGIEEGIVTPALRYGLISAGLIGGLGGWTVWTVAVLMLLACGVRASQVAKEERQ